jgi:hypothetical protein
MMTDGLVQPRTEGTPQGGPLSPLLSNILLTELDRELECGGHAFCRYADDCNIYVGSERAGQRLLSRLTGFLARRLKLTVNVSKSAVARPWQRRFLGYSMMWHRGAEAAHCGGEPRAADGAGEAPVAWCARAQYCRDHSDAQPPPAWLVSVFQADANQADAGRARRLATA